MRAREFILETGSIGSVVAGSVAPLSLSTGSMISRNGINKNAKYLNSVPVDKPWKKKHARR